MRALIHNELEKRDCGRKSYFFFPFWRFVEMASPQSAVCELHQRYPGRPYQDRALELRGIEQCPLYFQELAHSNVCEHHCSVSPWGRALAEQQAGTLGSNTGIFSLRWAKLGPVVAREQQQGAQWERMEWQPNVPWAVPSAERLLPLSDWILMSSDKFCKQLFFPWVCWNSCPFLLQAQRRI